MFDVSFTEFIVIGVVALIVIGPERLPTVARTVGHLLGRARRYVGDVKADINRELQLEELKRIQAELAESARSMEDSVRKEMGEAHAAFASSAEQSLAELEATVKSAPNDTAPPTETPPAPLEAASTPMPPLQPPPAADPLPQTASPAEKPAS